MFHSSPRYSYPIVVSIGSDESLALPTELTLEESWIVKTIRYDETTVLHSYCRGWDKRQWK